MLEDSIRGDMRVLACSVRVHESGIGLVSKFLGLPLVPFGTISFQLSSPTFQSLTPHTIPPSLGRHLWKPAPTSALGTWPWSVTLEQPLPRSPSRCFSALVTGGWEQGLHRSRSASDLNSSPGTW